MVHDLGAGRPTFDLVLQAEEHGRILFLLVAVEVEIRQGFGIFIHEEIEIEERLHTPIF